MNHQDTEDTEFNGDEGSPLPVTDFSVEDTDLVAVTEPEVVSTAPDVPIEVVDQSPIEDQAVTVVSEDVPEPLPETAEAAENGVAEKETLNPPKAVSGWQRVRSFFVGGTADDIARLHNLTQAIEDAPESAVNYVLRAELYMHMREYALAHLDFQRAYELAETQFELADWGLLDQVMRDRALTGLEKVQRRLR